MYLLVICSCAALLPLLLLSWIKRRKRRNENRDLESCSISPEALHTLMTSHEGVLLFDVRRPLDLLSDLEIIPGARRIAPNELQQKAHLISKDTDTVFYCTCPGDDTARHVVQQALRMRFCRAKLLRGGLPAWKAKGYSVVPYNTPFHLETRS